MAKEQKKGPKSTRKPKAAVGEMKRIRTRHAPDGTPVPIDSAEGITISEEYQVNGDLPPDWEYVTAKSRKEGFRISAGVPPPDGATILNEAYQWATRVLTESGYLNIDKNGRVTQYQHPLDEPSHSQSSLAASVFDAFQVVGCAIEDDDPLSAAHWAAFCTQQYEIARFKREEETLTVRGTKSTEAGRASSCRDPALVETLRQEAKKRWDKEPTLSARQLAAELEQRYPGYTKSTIRRLIAPDNPRNRNPL